MLASFGTFILIRSLNPAADIKLPLVVASLVLAVVCSLILCYQYVKYECIANDKCEQEDSEAKDSNEIVTLKTSLKQLTKCVNDSANKDTQHK